MDDCNVFVGLDYHQASVQVCVMNQRGQVLANKNGPNDAEAVIRAVEPLGQVGGVAIESCSGAADLAEELIRLAGWSVDLAHPGFVARMKQNPDKSDCTDAALLADLERVGYLPKVWLAPHEVRELRRLTRYRRQLAHDRRDIKLRIRALLRDQRLRGPGVRPWTKAWMAWLRSTKDVSEQSRWIVDRQLERLERVCVEIAEVEARLSRLTANDSLVQVLMEQSGIGPVTAWTIRAEVGRFDRFRSGKQLARFCGLSPRNASSGTRQADSGLIKAGNRHLRAVLIEAAHLLIRFDKSWRQFAYRLLDGGKPKCVIVAAVANRWIRRLYHRMQPGRLAA
jgi:transposase